MWKQVAFIVNNRFCRSDYQSSKGTKGMSLAVFLWKRVDLIFLVLSLSSSIVIRMEVVWVWIRVIMWSMIVNSKEIRLNRVEGLFLESILPILFRDRVSNSLRLVSEDPFIFRMANCSSKIVWSKKVWLQK